MSYRKAKKKKFIGVFVVAVAILIAAYFAVPFLGESEGYRTITVFEVSGTVGVVKDGIEYEAYPGMLLQEGHVIVTSENSYARLALDDDKYVKVESGSRLEFETLGLLGSGKTRIKLDRGAITTEIVNPLGEDEEYVVNTPNAVLAVRGTFFRVDLKVTEKGEIDTNVYTYGGKVASNRILPTGEVVEEEVIVDAGYMTAIRMDTVDTIYIVGTTDTINGVPVEEERKNTIPIYPADIPDDDLVDMYFASTNGHEMFISTQEIKNTIDTREILVEEHKPVYEKADEVKIQLQEETNTDKNSSSSTALIPDDKGDWEESTETMVQEPDEAVVEEVVDNENERESQEAVLENEEEIVQETSTEAVVEVPPVVDTTTKEEPHVHSYTSKITTQATCTTEGVKTYSCDCGETYTEAIVATGHTEVNGGTASSHTKCSTCGEVVNTSHSYTDTVTKAASCTDIGEMTHTCTCGYTYTTEIAAAGHTEVNGGTVGSHTECSTCGEVFSDSHSYTDTITTAASCTDIGEMTHTCTCGYTYTTEIAATGHTEVTSYTDGTADADGLRQVYCKVCNETLEEEVLFSIPKNFPDTAFASYISTTYDLDGHNSLSTTELATLQAATEVNVAGTAGSDGGIASLEGISYFTSMQTLNCGYNANLTDITLKNMSALTTLNCNNTSVTHLYLNTNSNLANVNVDGCTELLVIDIKDTAISQIDVTTNTNITSLDFQNTSITNIDLSNNMMLEVVRASGSAITTLDLSGHSILYYVLVENCTSLTSLNISGTDIATLDVQTATSLTELNLTNCTTLFLVETGGRTDEINIIKDRDDITID